MSFLDNIENNPRSILCWPLYLNAFFHVTYRKYIESRQQSEFEPDRFSPSGPIQSDWFIVNAKLVGIRQNHTCISCFIYIKVVKRIDFVNSMYKGVMQKHISSVYFQGNLTRLKRETANRNIQCHYNEPEQACFHPGRTCSNSARSRMTILFYSVYNRTPKPKQRPIYCTLATLRIPSKVS